MKTDDTLTNIRCSWYANRPNLNGSFSRIRSVASAIFTLFFLLIEFSCSDSTSRTEEIGSVYASLDTGVTYVGMNTCKQCHSDIYETYIRTGMGKSFGNATREKSSADFSGSPVVHDRFRNFSYRPRWSNDQLVFDEFRMSGSDTVYVRREPVAFIVGSGQHTNSHLQWLNGYLWQMPLTYYTQEKKWDLPPGFENGQNSRFSRKIELECISCHNGYPQLVTGSENKYAMIPSGIDCERCHGPGSRHVRLKQAGELIDTSMAIDYSIVNPAKLPIDFQLDLCQRCHIQGNSVLKRGKSFFDFKPGMRLTDVMDVYMPVYKGQEEEHIMASHAERMKMSKCFVVSKSRADATTKSGVAALRPYKQAMTCVTCHNPHVSVKETGSDSYNAACKNCHSGTVEVSSSLCTAPTEKRRLRNDNCVGCHMPKNNTIDIPHVTTTDHYIRLAVDGKTKSAIKEFVTIACINNPGADRLSRGEAFLNYYEKFVHDVRYLDSAKTYLDEGEEEDFATNYEALVRWAYLRQDYSQVVRYASRKSTLSISTRPKVSSREAAWTSYRVAESYQQLGNLKSAVAFYNAAVIVLPYQLDFRNKLAGALEESGNTNAARKEYEFILNEDQRHVSALVNYGYLLASAFNLPQEADRLYDRALAQDPDHVQALLNKTGISVLKGDIPAAKRYLERALKVDPNNRQGLAMKSMLTAR